MKNSMFKQIQYPTRVQRERTQTLFKKRNEMDGLEHDKNITKCHTYFFNPLVEFVSVSVFHPDLILFHTIIIIKKVYLLSELKDFHLKLFSS